jgi:ornithine cyclodeaminase/thiomorpholine-carboxylate dehydrogenase
LSHALNAPGRADRNSHLANRNSHLANLFVQDGRLRVLDWGDASIAHPFGSLVVTFRFLEQINRLVRAGVRPDPPAGCVASGGAPGVRQRVQHRPAARRRRLSTDWYTAAPAMEVVLLSEADVQRVLEPEALLDALATEFIALTRGESSSPARNEVVVPDAGFLLGMPAWRPSQPIAVKLVSVFHGNHQVGLPGHLALICLFDPATGAPIAIMDGTYITAARTAGAAALSVRLLARPNTRVLAILGAGVQGREHLVFVPRVRSFTEIRIASLYPEDAARLAATDPRARPVASFEEAVRGADVICLCTTSSEPVVQPEWVAPGAHITSVGYMPPGGELHPEHVRRGRLFVETRLAFEPTPVGCAELHGLDPSRGTELGEVLLDPAAGRHADQELTVYKAMGHAAEDMGAAALALARARELGVGQLVSL